MELTSRNLRHCGVYKLKMYYVSYIYDVVIIIVNKWFFKIQKGEIRVKNPCFISTSAFLL